MGGQGGVGLASPPRSTRWCCKTAVRRGREDPGRATQGRAPRCQGGWAGQPGWDAAPRRGAALRPGCARRARTPPGVCSGCGSRGSPRQPYPCQAGGCGRTQDAHSFPRQSPTAPLPPAAQPPRAAASVPPPVPGTGPCAGGVPREAAPPHHGG